MKHAGSIVCLSLALVCLFVGALTAWAKTQVLDTDAWVETSRETLQQPEVRTAVAHWTVDEVFDRTDPDEALAEALPDRLDVLAGPLTSRLREESYGVAENAMADPRVEQIWVAANQNAHERFVRIVHGDEPIVVETAGGVVLDLRPLLEGIAERIGVSTAVVDRIPEEVAQVTPRRSEGAQNSIALLRTLDTWGGIIVLFSLPLLAAGIYLARDRRHAWMWMGVGTVLIAALLVVTANRIGPLVAESLTTSLTWQAAVLATWGAVTQTLKDGAAAIAIIGIGMFVLAWSTAPTGMPQRARAVARPALVDRPEVTIAALTVLAAIVVASVDVLAERRLLTQLLMIAGVGITTWILCRMAADEAGTETRVSRRRSEPPRSEDRGGTPSPA